MVIRAINVWLYVRLTYGHTCDKPTPFRAENAPRRVPLSSPFPSFFAMKSAPLEWCSAYVKYFFTGVDIRL